MSVGTEQVLKLPIKKRLRRIWSVVCCLATGHGIWEFAPGAKPIAGNGRELIVEGELKPLSFSRAFYKAIMGIPSPCR
jgi:hypothetical protein